MIRTIVSIIALIVVAAAAIILILKYKGINTYLLKARHRTPFKPTENEFNDTLRYICGLDYEHKLALLQSLLGPRINILSHMTREGMSISAISIEGEEYIKPKDDYTG